MRGPLYCPYLRKGGRRNMSGGNLNERNKDLLNMGFLCTSAELPRS